MNLGIHVEATHAGSSSVEAVPPVPSAASPDAAGNPGALFGQLMAKALQSHAQPEPMPGLVQEGAPDTKPSAPETEGEDGEDISLALPDWLQPWPGMPTVQHVSVGPGLQAITASTTAPDANSVAAFARLQGLDAEAIAWLMNPPTAAQAMPPGGAATATLSSADLPVSAAATASAVTSGVMQVQAGLGSNAFAPDTPPTPQVTIATSMQEISAPKVVIGSAQAMTAASAIPGNWSFQQAGMPASSNAPGPQPLDASDPGTEAALRAAMDLLRWGQVRPLNTLSPGQSAAAGAAPVRNTPPLFTESTLDLSALVMATSGQVPQEDVDRGLSGDTQAPGTSLGDASAPLRSASGPMHGRHEPASSPAGASPATSDQMQQLSEQMADAIGERILRELERGHWSLRLMLKPAHLGHIEVEMRLRSGELDATFAAPQAATRELLQDGLNRLRDSLAQSGMDVANLHVKDGQNRQNGGDSTPGQRQFAQTAKTSETSDVPAAPVEFQPRPRRSDGWDVMV